MSNPVTNSCFSSLPSFFLMPCWVICLPYSLEQLDKLQDTLPAFEIAVLSYQPNIFLNHFWHEWFQKFPEDPEKRMDQEAYRMKVRDSEIDTGFILLISVLRPSFRSWPCDSLTNGPQTVQQSLPVSCQSSWIIWTV